MSFRVRKVPRLECEIDPAIGRQAYDTRASRGYPDLDDTAGGPAVGLGGRAGSASLAGDQLGEHLDDADQERPRRATVGARGQRRTRRTSSTAAHSVALPRAMAKN